MKTPVLTVLSVLLALSIVVMASLLWGEVDGFQSGMLATYGIEESSTKAFVTHGLSVFEFLEARYSAIAFVVCCFLLIQYLKSYPISIVVSLGLLVVALVSYVQLLLFKYDVDDSSVLLYRDLLVYSIRLDWLGFLASALLFVFQSLSIFKLSRAMQSEA